jgi:hypothetical protein
MRRLLLAAVLSGCFVAAQAKEPVPVGDEFQGNSFPTSVQYWSSVGVDSVVVWESYGSYGTDNDSWSIQGQRFDARGRPVGGEFPVNSATSSYQQRPAVAMDTQGRFVVAWVSGYSPYHPPVGDIRAQACDAQGTPKGNDFLGNTFTTGRQFNPAVSRPANGSFVVMWYSPGSYGTDNSGSSIQGQLYSTRVLFADGFESGDTSAWSRSQP